MITEFSGKYNFLSNFYPCTIIYNSLIFPSVENAYQASKCKNEEDMYKFINIPSHRAKRLGKRIEVKDTWDSIKLETMKALVSQKFTKSLVWENLLLSTLPDELVEGNWWNDTFWGKCNDIGENHLGKILMEVRDTIYGMRESNRC